MQKPLIISAIFTSLCMAQSFDQIPVSTNVDSARGVSLNIRNNSHKTITAVKWFVEGRYSDGSVKTSDLDVDWVSDLIIIENNQDQSFRPGMERTVPTSLPLGPNGELPVITQAKLTAIVFSDNTGIGDKEQIRIFGAIRKSMANNEAEALNEIDRAFHSPSPKDTLRSAFNDREAKKKSTSGTLTQTLGLLEKDAPIETVKSIVATLARYRDVLVQHSNLEAK
jgi:hypothetical protein